MYEFYTQASLRLVVDLRATDLEDGDIIGTDITVGMSGGTVVTGGVEGYSAQGGQVFITDTGRVTYAPPANFNGTDTIEITVTDQGTPPVTSTQTLTIDVQPANDAPVISDNVSTADLTETGSAISANGSISVLDPDTSDSLSADVTSVVIGGTFSTSGSTLPAALSDNNNQALINMLSLGATTGISADQPDGSSIAWTFTSGAQGVGAFTFLKAGADKDAKGSGGWTALMVAAYRGQVGIARAR